MGVLFVSVPMVSLAQISGSVGGTTNGVVGGTNGSIGGSTFQLQNPLGFNTICGLVKAIFNALLALGAPIAVLFLVYAGFKFIIARDDTTKLKEARSNLVHVVAGIAIFLGAWVLGQVIAATINSLAVAGGQPSVTGNTCN